MPVKSLALLLLLFSIPETSHRILRCLSVQEIYAIPRRVPNLFH
jgi:hypothetical protein